MPPPSPPARRPLFLVVALLLPVACFAGLEGVLRAVNYGGDLRLFVRPAYLHGDYATVNRRFAARYFSRDEDPPSAPNDAFLVRKPANGFRLFVLGESAAAGFPYGYNGTFSRLLRDALQDVMPTRHVEVVNLGMAAVSSYVLYDQIDEILAERPDAIMIYAGHNEFYGALGAGSAVRFPAAPAVVRGYLRLQRLRTARLARNAVTAALGLAGNRGGAGQPASFMRRMARDETIILGSPTYVRGRVQFASNLRAILRRFGDAGVPVFVGSLASNLRTHAPFRSVVADGLPAADDVFVAAQTALARGDAGTARRLFRRARDLDALRFRASGEFNDVLRAGVRAESAHYVPVEEVFAAAAPDSLPGHELFWEHLHPTEAGTRLLARAFYEALRGTAFLGQSADTHRFAGWARYATRMELSEFDRRFAWHEVRLLTSRWPFVRDSGGPGPAPYVAVTAADSLAVQAVQHGVGWARAKVALAELYRARGQYRAALGEYRGLAREDPHNDSPLTYAARLHLLLHEADSARGLLERAYVIAPSGFTCYALGSLELRAGNLPRAIGLIEESLRFAPDNPSALFDLSRAYALDHQPGRARAYADQVARIHPGFPGLREWQALLARVVP